MTAARIETKFATTSAEDAGAAVREIAGELVDGEHRPTFVLFFCAPSYDLPTLAAALTEAFDGVTVVGCTSAGQIGPAGFHKDGISAIALFTTEMVAQTHLIRDLSSSCEAGAAGAAAWMMKVRETRPAGWKTLGLLLVDGLSLMVEQLTATLYLEVGDIPIVGGSAGDDLAFKETFVYVDGVFTTDAALLLTLSTSLSVVPFKFQHYAGTDRRFVVTRANAATRTVYEIDGEPAAEAYARLVGVPVEDLDPQVFSANPVVLDVGGDPYVRSIAKVNEDLSLTFLCAIDQGTVLSIGESEDPLVAVERAFTAVHEEVPAPALVLGCDCILRRVQLEHQGLAHRIGEAYSANKVFGFSTYGEQFNGIHANQTFAGIAIGG